MRFTIASTITTSNLALQCIGSHYLTEHASIAALSTGEDVLGQQVGLSLPI